IEKITVDEAVNQGKKIAGSYAAG
ncbi:uncharacterized protein METZ01_LOCUS347694, partial [marine metagenome]